MRYFLDVSYHGGPFHGWQRQLNAKGVQEVLEHALRTVLRITDLEVTGSGRTDTGVHARQQIVHLDLPSELSEQLIFRINCVLPKSISINSYQIVADRAHARFDAIRREYEYHIHQNKNPFKDGLSWLYDRELNITAMNEAAALMLTHEDFQCFSKTHTDVEHYNCDIYRAEWQKTSDGFIFHIAANRFLRGMVRAVVGSLIPIGKGQAEVQSFQKILDSRDRRYAGAAAPPEGLYLTKVIYPEEIYIK
jgi:tRNA pseudouridine38-40 synthase